MKFSRCSDQHQRQIFFTNPDSCSPYYLFLFTDMFCLKHTFKYLVGDFGQNASTLVSTSKWEPGWSLVKTASAGLICLQKAAVFSNKPGKFCLIWGYFKLLPSWVTSDTDAWSVMSTHTCVASVAFGPKQNNQPITFLQAWFYRLTQTSGVQLIWWQNDSQYSFYQDISTCFTSNIHKNSHQTVGMAWGRNYCNFSFVIFLFGLRPSLTCFSVSQPFLLL